MKTFVLCADDFGYSEAVNRGILDLVAKGRLSAVSCMSDRAAWPEAAQALQPYANQVAVGLHFNLTETQEPIPLVKLMQQSFSGRIDQQYVEMALLQQLEAFEQAWGRAPDFVDGHQHVHIFRGIRETLLHCLQQRYPTQKPWLRQVNPSLSGHDATLKAIVLRALGQGFSAQAQAAGFRLSAHFAGLYSLNPQADFPKLLGHWLTALPEGALIMCHPGALSPSQTGMALTRRQEYDWLASDAFALDLKQRHLRLSPTPAFA